MEKNKSLLENKKVTLIFSLVCVLIFWFVLKATSSAAKERIISVPLYLDTTGTAIADQGLSVIGDNYPNSVNVKVKGESYIVNSLTEKDITVKPIYTGISSAGYYTLDLSAVNNTNKKFEIESVETKNLSILFDYIDKTKFNVNIKVKNAVAKEGLVLGRERFTNSENFRLKVTGPRSIVEQISRVDAVMKFEASKPLKKTTSAQATIMLYDKKGNKVPKKNLILSATGVNITVPVYKTKTVGLKLSIENAPANFSPSYKMYLNGVETSRIAIEAAPDIVETVKSIPIENIDIKELSGKNNTFIKNIVLPNGVYAVNNEASVKVVFDTDDITSKKVAINSIKAINNKNNYNVKLIKNFDAVIYGSKEVIDNIDENDLYAQIDLDGKVSGIQTFAVKVKNSKDNIWQSEDINVKVEVIS